MSTQTAIQNLAIQNLWFDAFTLAANLVLGNIAVEVVPDSDHKLPYLRTRQKINGPVVVELWPTDDGSAWHAHAPGQKLVVIPVDQHPRKIVAELSRLHWRAPS
jgi:hypothetical protein